MYEYPKRFGDSGPDWIIDLETQEGHPYNLLKSIEKVMGDPKYAIEAMNGSDMGGRSLKVNEARPREERPRRPAPPR